MGIAQIPLPSAASKTRYTVTLTSGTSWTVPTGVTYINATLIGGGGAGNGMTSTTVPYETGLGGQIITTTLNTTPGASITYAIGAGGTGAVGDGGAGGTTTFTGATSALGGAGSANAGNAGLAGRAGLISANWGGSGRFVSANANGGNGGAGSIEIEYWV